eukprot:NODE_19_length_39463_cov_0.396073.p17 type:complete len:220 gc:universal NODE_19_length_39463_cov_0.396073:34311-34970(+)
MNLASTNDDATNCRCSCHLKRYINDPYVEWFSTYQSKSPLINRGTYFRTQAIDEIVREFLKTHPKGQILSLGAGFDTRFFRMQLSCKYVEIDKDEVILEKLNKLRKHLKKLKILNCSLKPSGLVSDSLEIRHHDVLGINSENIDELIDFKNPTLVIAECIFVYLDPDRVDILIKLLSERNASIVVYDPLDTDDNFSHQMKTNLRAIKSNIAKKCKPGRA